MSGPTPTLGYRSRSQAAVALRAQGLTYRQIADRIGVEVQVASALVASGRRARRVQPITGAMLVQLDTATLEALSPAASARSVTLATLASRLLTVLARDNLIDAILDDTEAK